LSTTGEILRNIALMLQVYLAFLARIACPGGRDGVNHRALWYSAAPEHDMVRPETSAG
jgi:hypothetical protein